MGWVSRGWPPRRVGRISQDAEALILRLSRENACWGHGKIAGELIKLDIILSESMIRNVLSRHSILQEMPPPNCNVFFTGYGTIAVDETGV